MSNIDKQWLQQKIADMEAARDEIPFGLDEDDSNTLTALRIALASLEAEPVAWIWSNRKHPSEVTLVRPEDDEKAEAAQWSGWSCQALCAVDQAALPQSFGNSEQLNSPVIADGWKLAPVEPTLEMIKAGANAASAGMLMPGMYRAMLAAAPQQEVKP